MIKIIDTLKNIAHAALNPENAKVMATKAHRRVFDPRGGLSPAEHQAWLKQRAVTMDTFLERFDQNLVAEANAYTAWLSDHAHEVLSAIPHDLGGGGGVPLLYLITRLKQPETIVETGVAAGFSSATFLAALKKNGSGCLYSSDFPYFRIKDPEKYIGVVVPQELRADWSLFINGDLDNMAEILPKISSIDIFHYDSDKYYAGRTACVDSVYEKLSPTAVFMMDDIQDNCYFHDFVKAKKVNDFHVIEYDGKHIGYIDFSANAERS